MKDEQTENRLPLRIRLLVLLPWILFITFLVSFFLEFSSIYLTLWGYPVTADGFLRFISVGGLIGFLTNWIAITMLFRPVEKRPLLGQGLIPAQKDVISKKLSVAIQKNLINADLIFERIEESGIIGTLIDTIEDSASALMDKPEFRTSLYHSIENALKGMVSDESLRNEIANRVLSELGQAIPQGSVESLAFKTYIRFRGNEARAILSRAIESVPSLLKDNRSYVDDFIESIPLEIRKHRPNLELYMKTVIRRLTDEIDIQSIIFDKLTGYDEQRLETLVKSSTMDQLNYIKYLGAVLGVLGGLVIWNPLVALIVIGPLVVLLLLADHILANLK